MTKENEIKLILASLNKQLKDEDNFDTAVENTMDTLVELPIEFNLALPAVSKEYLHSTSDGDGFIFNLMLDVLFEREQYDDVEKLASEALLSSNRNDKLFYTETLIDLPLESISTILTKALPTLESFDEFAGYSQEKIIDFLTEKKEKSAAQAVVSCIHDIAPRVRASVLLYIEKLNYEEAANSMLEQLRKEDWEFNIEIILRLFRKWRRREFLDTLIELSKQDYIVEDSDVHSIFLETINQLSTR